MTLTKKLEQHSQTIATIARAFWAQHAPTVGLTYGIAGVLLVLLWGGVFIPLQQRMTDIYFTDRPTSQSVVLVGLDDASFQAYGRSPALWSRGLYAQLVERMDTAGARVLAFDLLFAEVSPEDEAFATAINAARTSETRLRVVLAAAGGGTPFYVSTPSEHRLHYPHSLDPVMLLKAEATYLGYVNAFPDTDGQLRRQPSLFQIQEDTQLSLSLASYLAYLRIPASAWQQVVSVENNALNVTPERQLAVDSNGLWRQNFFGQPNNVTFATYSFKDVLEGVIALEVFKDKIVLVGIINSTGITDQFLVPITASGQPMTGVEIQANAIESLIQDATLEERPASDTALFTFLAASLVVLVMLLPKWLWRVPMVVLLIGAWLLFGSLEFTVAHRIHLLLYPILALLLPMGALTWRDALMIRRQRNKLATEASYLTALNDLKTHMIRMASHDLKNPLSRIMGYAELINMDGNLTPTQTRFLGHIRESTHEMNSIITDILNLEQIRGIQDQKKPVLLPHLVMQVVTSQEPDMYRKNQTFEDRISQEAIYVMGSLHQLSQATANLISNAVKYTPDGGKITVSVYKDAHYAYLKVEDTGYGIPESAIPKLFTDFYRVKTEATATISGTGLGLSLVKTVVDAHQGVITVKSQEGVGSVFTVQLPLQHAP